MAPRKCYTKLLAKGNAKKMISLSKAIQSPFCLPEIVNNGLDVGIFDEAHRMQKKPYMYKGNDMLEDAINASKVSVFFVNNDQRITTKDIYDVDTIIEYGTKINAVVHKPYELVSQFRCDGSDGYISFINNLLEIKQTTNYNFEFNKLDVKVFDDANIMRDELRKLNNINHKTRMIAG